MALLTLAAVVLQAFRPVVCLAHAESRLGWDVGEVRREDSPQQGQQQPQQSEGGDETREVEPFVRRACKFAPLPSSLDEGYREADGSVRIADVFGLPSVALARGGHRVTLGATAGTTLTLAVQVPYATTTELFVDISDGAAEGRSCASTWGAGGRRKQCTFTQVPLRGGTVTLTFRALGLGEESLPADGFASPTACVPVRVDLDIGESAGLPLPCGGGSSSPPLLAAGMPLPVAFPPERYSASSVAGGAVWVSSIPTSVDKDGLEMVVLFTQVTYPFRLQPLQLLLEEVTAQEDYQPTLPACLGMCVGGTPVASGQVLQRALPPGLTFRLWLLAQETVGGDTQGFGLGYSSCTEFELELSVKTLPAGDLQAQYLGPPAWLCEGSPWPARLEQILSSKIESLLGPDSAGDVGPAAALRGRKLELRDVFELTRLPPRSSCSGVANLGGLSAFGGFGGLGGPQASECASVAASGGLHTLEIQVVTRSLFRLTTHAASVMMRPVLVSGDSHGAWNQLHRRPVAHTAEIPGPGGEPRHSIHAELGPGTYTLVFVMTHALGGLRPCASVFVHLELAAMDSLVNVGGAGEVHGGTCVLDTHSDMLRDQAQRASQPLDSFVDRGEDYMLTLPRPLESPPLRGTPTERDVEVLAREPLDLQKATAAGPVLLRAVVTSPFLMADLMIQVYSGGSPLGDPQPAADGGGYVTVVGPLSPGGNYEIKLLRVPQRPPPPGGPFCVTFSVDVATVAVAAPVGSAFGSLSSLPGSSMCSSAAPDMPERVYVVPGKPSVVDGEFLLPDTGKRTINIEAVPSGGSGDASNKPPLVVRAILSSADGEVRLDSGRPNVFNKPQLEGLEEDRLLLIGGSGTESLGILSARFPKATLCPTVHLHLVAIQAADVPACPWPAGDSTAGATEDARLRKDLRQALEVQRVDQAVQRTFVATVPAVGVNVDVPFEVKAPMVEVKIDFVIEPPWMPLEAFVEGAGEVWGRARATGHRLALLLPSLPGGAYRLKLQTWEGLDPSGVEGCATITGSAVVLEPSGRDTSNFRQELLNLPELLAVLPLPQQQQMPPWWHSASSRLVFTRMNHIQPDGEMMKVEVLKPVIIRLLAEPADILSPSVTLEIRQGDRRVAGPAELSGSVPATLTEAGAYTLHFKPTSPSECPTCAHQGLPYIITIGVAPLDVLGTSATADMDCPKELPELDIGKTPSGTGAPRLVHRQQWLRVEALRRPSTIALEVPRPSVVLFAAWSPFVDRYVRVALRTEEGLWVGEQRFRRAALEIELPPGRYSLEVSEPSQVSLARGCLVFSLAVTVAALSLPSSPATVRSPQLPNGAGGAARALGLGARCEGLGASPLPLDVFSDAGGSISLGGPANSEGQLLVRHRALLTDIHDGRKKVFLRAPSRSIFRAAVLGGDAAVVELALEDAKHHVQHPDNMWSHGRGGWSMVYTLEQAGFGMWLNFHREHRDALSSGCAVFDLMLQMMPERDVAAMTRCPGSGGTSSREFFDRWKFEAAGFDRAEMVALGAGGRFSEVLRLDVDGPTLVEVEVQFNFLLSDVGVWLSGAAPQRLQAGPDIGPVNDAEEALNARSVLRLRLDSGSYSIPVVHRSALPSSLNHGGCFPLRASVRRTPWRPGNSVLAGPALSVPVPFGYDLVLTDVSPTDPTGSQTISAAPTVGGLAPTGFAEFGGGAVRVWDHDALAAVAAAGVGTVEGRRVSRLPVRLNVCHGSACHYEVPAMGDPLVALVLDNKRGGVPWAGQDRPLKATLPPPPPPVQLFQPPPPAPPLLAPPPPPPPVLDWRPQTLPVRPEQPAPDRPPIIARPPEDEETHEALTLMRVAHAVCWLVVVGLVCLCTGKRSYFTGTLQWLQENVVDLLVTSDGSGRREMSSVVEVTARRSAARKAPGYGSTV